MKQLDFLEQDSNTDVKKNIITIFVDGAARNNPGPAGAGVYVTHNGETWIEQGFFLGSKTNNQAEYLALALAIFLTKNEITKRSLNDAHLAFTSDSELLVKQMKGAYKVKNPELQKIKSLVNSLLQNISYTTRHVLREENKTADQLANVGIDKKQPLPVGFLTLLADHDVAI